MQKKHSSLVIRISSFAAACALAFSLSFAPAARAAGPSPREVERSVDRALKFLRDRQAADGSFPTSVNVQSTAVTSLAALAYLARGHLPGEGEYGETINRAIDNVLAAQSKSGLLTDERASHAMYDHGVSAVMLCEAYAMASGKTSTGQDRKEAIKIAVAKSVRLILAAQQVPKAPAYAGGWRYLPNATDSDLSVSGWQLMALRGAANIGAPVPKRAIDDGIQYVKAQQKSSGGFQYNVELNKVSPALTGTGVLALQLLGKHDSKEVIDGGQYLLKAIQDKHSAALEGLYYYYTVYYCSQAAAQLGDKYDREINDAIRTSLLRTQKENGSWSATGAESAAGQPYATAMAALALSVQFKYLPLYQLK